MYRKFGLSVIVCILISTNAFAQPSEAAKVDKLFAAWDRKDSPGCVVLVRQDGKTLYERAFGMSHLELGVPLSLSSVFLLASVSKQFVVFLIMMLAQGGRISLDDDVRKYVPEVPNFGKTITIRHLIHHTSGLREDLTSFNLAGWRAGDVTTRDDFMRFVKNQKELNFEPGSEYLYCNTGYHLLAIIVERVTKQPMPEYAREQIFEPLAMKATVVRDNHRTLIPGLVSPYQVKLDGSAFGHARVAHDPPGASNIHSNVADLARWDQNYYDATVGGKKLIEQMHERFKLNNGKLTKYAGGLFIDEYRGLKTVSHTGWHGGYKTVILRVPEERFSVIILANQRECVPLRLAKKVADIYLKERLEKGDVPQATQPAPDGARLAEFAGDYRVGQSLWHIGQDKQGLFVQIDGGAEKKRLIASAAAEFFDVEDGMRYRFVNKKDDMLLEANVEKTKLNGKRLRFVDPPAEKLAELTGTYRSAELGVFNTLEVRKGKVFMHTPKGEMVLQFLDGGECIARPKDAYYSMAAVRFTRNDAGAVTGYALTTERVRNLRYAKVKVE